MASAMTPGRADERPPRAEPEAGPGAGAGVPCADPRTDPDLFFPVGDTGLATQRQVAAAKALCARCPIMERCREWAVTSGEPEGIWGGTTPEERRHLRRQLPRLTRADSRVA